MKKEASKENNIELDNKIKNAQNNIAKYKSLLVIDIIKKFDFIIIIFYYN